MSDVAFAARHAVNIVWSKPQETPIFPEVSELEFFATPTQFVFKMMSIATPEPKQSEAYIATVALFFIFGSSGKEEKVSLRLPATWKDLWLEFAEAKKSKADENDRATIRHLRDLVRKRAEQELEDGVLIQGFKGRGQSKNLTDSEHSDHERAKRQPWGPEYYQNIWMQKTSSARFQHMLVSAWLPITDVLLTAEALANATTNVAISPTGCRGSRQGAGSYYLW